MHKEGGINQFASFSCALSTTCCVHAALQEDDADSFLDLLAVADPIRALVQKSLTVMRGH